MMVNDEKWLLVLMLRFFYIEKCWEIIVCFDIGKLWEIIVYIDVEFFLYWKMLGMFVLMLVSDEK